MNCRTFVALLFCLIGWSSGASPLCAQGKQEVDPLPSWNAGVAKKAILDFVRVTTDKKSESFVPIAERVATFDNDGTLWAEQPIYAQLTFALDRVKALAPKHPEWKAKESFKAILDGDRAALAKLSKKDLIEIIGETHSGMSVEEFRTIAKDWLAKAKHPRFKRPYTECVYQPMLEVMRYLRANGFKTYIVTGGGQEFVRVFSEKAYGIPREQVIGSALRTKFTYKNKRPMLLRLPQLLLLDDEEGKPEDIELFIGRKPLAAFGNSDGDRQMLEWTQSGAGVRLMILVSHDDGKREYAYGADSKIGKFSDALKEEAKKQRWTVISMKNDWKHIFPYEIDRKIPVSLIGKWVGVGGAQDGAAFEFFADGRMSGRINVNGQLSLLNASIHVENDKLYSTTHHPRTGEADTRVLSIRKLSPRELILEDEQRMLLKLERAE